MAVEFGRIYPRNDVLTFQRDEARRETPAVARLRRYRATGIVIVRKTVALLVIGAILVATGVFAGILSYSRSEPKYATVVVSRGDTLWTIARKAKPGTDPRKTIYQIKQVNELESVNLKPGQTLMIPM